VEDIFSSEPPEGTNFTNTSDLWLPELGYNTFLLFSDIYFIVISYENPVKFMHILISKFQPHVFEILFLPYKMPLHTRSCDYQLS
jgi:hypothetical protein